MFNTFEQIFKLFENICLHVDEPITCIIWVSKQNFVCIRDFIKRENTADHCKYSQYDIFLFYNRKSILITTPDEDRRGYRCQFSAYDDTIDLESINNIIRPTCLDFTSKSFHIERKNKCNHCICKTCAIAQINGGASGCGNCKDCDLTDGCRSCNEYYNLEPIRNE